MIIEFHDAEVGNTLSGRLQNIDYDYQAEQTIQDLGFREDVCRNNIVKFILIDEEGERAVWEKIDGKIRLMERSPRFTGDWQLGNFYEKANSNYN